MGIKRGTSYRKEIKRPPNERHKKRTHGNLIVTFRHSQGYFSIRRDNVCEYTVKMEPRDVTLMP